MINIFYYHGLDSVLSDEKREVLERFGNVIAPTFDYRNIAIEDVLTELIDIQFNVDCDLVIGSSFGGLMAYTAAELKDLPCLIFNPALYANSLNWDMYEVADETFRQDERTSLVYIVLGQKDKVVEYEKNYKFIEENVEGGKTIISIPDLEHRIPLDVFEEHVKCFFQTIHPSFMLFD